MDLTPTALSWQHCFASEKLPLECRCPYVSYLDHWPTDVQFLSQLTAANWSGCNMTLQTVTDIKASLIYQTLDTIPDTTFVSLSDGIWRFITRGEVHRGKVQKRKKKSIWFFGEWIMIWTLIWLQWISVSISFTSFKEASPEAYWKTYPPFFNCSPHLYSE